MRLLHTSDWHVGRVTYNVSRRRDLETIFEEIVVIGREFAPDLIVHTGDFFDASMPAVDDMRFGVEMLERLSDLAPTVVICGNHENPKLFALFDRLRGSERLRFVDKPRPPHDGGILEYPSRAGERIRLAALPFVRNTTYIAEFGDPAAWSSVYGDNLAMVESMYAAALATGDHRRDIPVFAAHLHVSGAVLARSERTVHIDDFATKPEAIPPVSYAAFGHIHKPQEIGGRPWARYAGSPIQLDFGELDEQKSIVLVEASPGTNVHVKVAPLSGGRPLRRARGTLQALAASSAAYAGSLVEVVVDGPSGADLYERVEAALPHAVILRVQSLDPNRSTEAVAGDLDAAERSLPELFTAYLADHGAAAADNRRIAALFSDAYKAVEAQQPMHVPELDEEPVRTIGGAT